MSEKMDEKKETVWTKYCYNITCKDSTDEFSLFSAGYDARSAEVNRLKAKLAKYEKALELYAEYKNDDPDNDYNNEKAREVLEKDK